MLYIQHSYYIYLAQFLNLMDTMVFGLFVCLLQIISVIVSSSVRNCNICHVTQDFPTQQLHNTVISHLYWSTKASDSFLQFHQKHFRQKKKTKMAACYIFIRTPYSAEPKNSHSTRSIFLMEKLIEQQDVCGYVCVFVYEE